MHGNLFIYVFLGALAVLIFVLTRLRASSRTKQRSEVFRSMGFVETTRTGVFADLAAITRALRDWPAASISTWVGRGRSILGESVVFDFLYDCDSGSAFTVVGFRVDRLLPDFQIRHAVILDRFASGVGKRRTHGPRDGLLKVAKRVPVKFHPNAYQPPALEITIAANPEFGKHYRVYITDEASATSVRTMLTTDFINTLATMNLSDLYVQKSAEWLFVFQWISNPAPPTTYPALLRRAVSIAQKLDFRSAIRAEAAMA